MLTRKMPITLRTFSVFFFFFSTTTQRTALFYPSRITPLKGVGRGNFYLSTHHLPSFLGPLIDIKNRFNSHQFSICCSLEQCTAAYGLQCEHNGKRETFSWTVNLHNIVNLQLFKSSDNIMAISFTSYFIAF